MLNLDRLSRLRTLRHAAFAIAVCGASSALAQAGNPTAGATLYAQRAAPGSGVSCQDCHGFAGIFRGVRLAGLNEAAVFARVDGAIRGNTVFIMDDRAATHGCGRLYRDCDNATATASVCSATYTDGNTESGDVQQHRGWEHQRDGNCACYE